MRLYKIGEKGELLQSERLDFNENDIYLVDDEEKNTKFIWIGIKVSPEKKEITEKTAKNLTEKYGNSAKIEIMEQNNEYGSFLAMMPLLKRGDLVERRPELNLEPKRDINEKPDFEDQIRGPAYFLSLDKYSYKDLCWMLAEKIQNINLQMPSIEDIRQKAQEIFGSSSTYEEICWLNAEMDFLIKEKHIEKEKKNKFDLF